MGFFIAACLIMMLVLWFMHATDFLRACDIADFRIPFWFIFTPIFLPIFVIGLVVIILMIIFGYSAGRATDITRK